MSKVPGVSILGVGDGRGGGRSCPRAYSIQEQRFNIKTNQPKIVLQSKSKMTYRNCRSYNNGKYSAAI